MKNSGFTGFLAITGTLLLWFPFLFLLVVTISNLMSVVTVSFDPLILVEVFPAPFLGALMLTLAAFRARQYRAPAAIGTAVLGLSALCMHWIAPIPELATGLARPEGAALTGVAILLVLYILALAGLCAAGTRFVRRLYPKRLPEITDIPELEEKPPVVPGDEFPRQE